MTLTLIAALIGLFAGQDAGELTRSGLATVLCCAIVARSVDRILDVIFS